MLSSMVRRLAISTLAMSMTVAAAGIAVAAETLRVDAADSGCPRRKDVIAALETRLPGVTRGPPGRGAAERRLQLEPGPAGTVSLRLWDERGTLALERRLGGDEAVRPGGPAGCQALADAAALVVERYLRDIGYRPPAASVPEPPAPAPPPTPTPPAATAATSPATRAPAAPVSAAPTTAQAASRRQPAPAATGGPASASLGLLGVGGALRLGPAGRPEGTGGSGGARGEVVLAFELHRGWIAAALAGGVSSALVRPVTGAPGGELRLRSFPLRAHLGVPVPVAAGVLVPALGFSADLVSFRGAGLADEQAGVRFDPAAEAALGYVTSLGPLYLRLTAAGGLTLAPRDYSVDPPGIALYRSPAAYLRTQVEVGVRLWKN
jgi:hypothetical protein